MRTHSKETQSSLTPDLAVQILREGNDRFIKNLKANRNLLQQVNETSDGQYPFATILSCIACNHVEMGNLTTLLNKIQPAIYAETTTREDRTGKNAAFVNNVTELNVHLTIGRIRRESPIIAELEKSGQIKIIGGMYNVETGKVDFY